MTDAEFAALQERLLRRQAETGVPAAHRGDVLDLLAELGRLRKPPDVSGLMPAAELAEVREWEALADDELAPVWAHIDAQAALVRELYGVVADLHADDPGRQALLERGRAEGRWQAAALADAASAGWVDALGTPREPIRGVADKIRALGPCRPPPPPCESEARAADRDRLRAALVHVVAALDDYEAVGHGQYPGPVFDAIHAAREALTEDAR